jgi:hypothetical protein
MGQVIAFVGLLLWGVPAMLLVACWNPSDWHGTSYSSFCMGTIWIGGTTLFILGPIGVLMTMVGVILDRSKRTEQAQAASLPSADAAGQRGR